MKIIGDVLQSQRMALLETDTAAPAYPPWLKREREKALDEMSLDDPLQRSTNLGALPEIYTGLKTGYLELKKCRVP